MSMLLRRLQLTIMCKVLFTCKCGLTWWRFMFWWWYFGWLFIFKDGGPVIKDIWLVWEICVSSICNCCSGENFDVEMKFSVDRMSLIFIVLEHFCHTFASSLFNNNFIDAFSSSNILILSVKLSTSRLSLL